jgi:hypothetical protein
MPSHIFTRLGLWQDSISSNLAAAQAAHDQHDIGEQLHAMDYLVYAYLQLGRYADARRILDQLSAMQSLGMSDFKVGYAATAMPVRYAVERHRWDEAAKAVPDEKAQPQVAAITAWARALSKARGHHVSDVSAELSELRLYESQANFHGSKDYWAPQIQILREEALAWSLQAGGKPREAEAQMRAAADQEDAMEKLPVTPGPIVPAREQLGELLLQQHRNNEAASEFEVSLANSPNRKNAIDSLKAAKQITSK